MYEILYAHPRAAVGGNTPRSYGMFSTMLRIALPIRTLAVYIGMREPTARTLQPQPLSVPVYVF